jgi:DNA-directed RNA polymerase subunit M/transcription elongation factor TFIIS
MNSELIGTYICPECNFILIPSIDRESGSAKNIRKCVKCPFSIESDNNTLMAESKLPFSEKVLDHIKDAHMDITIPHMSKMCPKENKVQDVLYVSNMTTMEKVYRCTSCGEIWQ